MKYKLGDVCTFYSGTGFPKKYQGNVDARYPFYKVGDISRAYQNNERYLTDSDNYIDGEVVQEIKGTIIPKDTVVFAKIGEALKLNRRALTSKESLIDNNAIGIKPDKKFLHPTYFFYFMIHLNMQDYAEATTVPSVRKSTLERVEINIPDMKQQLLIVKKLDTVKDILSKRDRQKMKLDQLIKSRFVEMFSDSCKVQTTLDKVCENIVDCPHSTPKYYGELKYPAIRTSEIKEGVIDWKTMKYVSHEEYIKRNRRLTPKYGDIVYAREGTYGNAVMIPKGINFCLGQRVMLFRPDFEKVTSEYLLYAILSDDVKRQADLKNNMATVPHVNVADAREFVIMLPNLQKQKSFSNFVFQVDKLRFLAGIRDETFMRVVFYWQLL